MTNQGMEKLISLINRLQDAASTAGMSLGALELPQIAVVGGQSAGKSSVLENFVGRDFLPRGSGIVTRRPLVLQLNPSQEEYGEFLHMPNKKFHDFGQISEEIQNETNRLTGTGKGVSKIPINLRVYSPHVLELTLVDLPGLTRVPVGDQPLDIEEQIRSMILEYIANDSTLILAVSPANQDLANSDALKLAALVDPERDRTIGVITKLDLMDKGTDAREILGNNVYHLQRGYVGLVNRSQQDIDKKKDINVAQEEEMKYFLAHEAYKHMADRMGSKYLQTILNKQLLEHIRKKLPKLSADIKKRHAMIKEDLIKMNVFNEHNEHWKSALLIKTIQTFAEDLKIDIEGYSVSVQGEQFSAGAKINTCIYHEIYDSLKQVVSINIQELEKVIRNLEGYRNGMFMCGLSFDIAVRQLLEKYRDPLQSSVDLISPILTESIGDCTKKMEEYPKLKAFVIEIISERLKIQEAKTKKHLKRYLDAQISFMNTKHPDFVQSFGVLGPKIEQEIQSSPNLNGSNESLATLSNFSQPQSVPNSPMLSDHRGTLKNSNPVHKGWIFIYGTMMRKTKEYWFVLTSETLMWYKNDEEKEMSGNLYISGITLTKSSKNKRYTLTKNGEVHVHKDFPKISLLFRSEVEEDAWCKAYQQVGIKLEVAIQNEHSLKGYVTFDPNETNASKLISKGNTKGKENVKMISQTTENPNIDALIQMIQTYISIVQRDILDVMPKFITLLLVNGILDFARFHLLAEITKRESWDALMEENSEEVEKRKNKLALYEATKKALDIISDVSFS